MVVRRRRRRARAQRPTASERALQYMDLEPGTPIQEITLDRVFIGSCTNSRIGDLRAAAEGRRGPQGRRRRLRDGRPGLRAGQAPGRGARACDEVFTRGRLRLARRGLLDVPGHEPRHRSQPGERCASTSNRNFEGRQGRGGRTHLVSPADGRRGRHRGPLRRHPRLELSAMEPDHRRRAAPSRVLDRDDVDTDQIIPKQFLKRVERTGFGEFLFYDWAKEPGWDLPTQPDPRHRAQLRLRLLARARAVGARGLRLQGDHRAVVRRHLLLQLHEDRPAAVALAEDDVSAVADGRGRGARSTSRPRRSASTGGTVALRDRPRDQAPPAQRPRRHRADARSRTTRSPPTSASASARARSPRRS